MTRTFLSAGVAALVSFVHCSNGQGVWQDGQDAASVLGQADFTGNDGNRDEIAPAANTLFNPGGMALDPTTGKLFVSDSFNNRILRYSSVAALENGASAEGVLGQLDFVSRTFGLTQNKLNFPGGIFVDNNGALWVCDGFNRRVLRFDNASEKFDGANADGVLGQTDFVSDNDTPSQSGFFRAFYVIGDAAGSIWVCDTASNRILRYDNADEKPNGANADAVLGQQDFDSIGSGLSASAMDEPRGLAIDSQGSLWVADTKNNRILRFSDAATLGTGAAADSVLGQPDLSSNVQSTSPVGLVEPHGISVGPADTLWIHDVGNKRAIRHDEVTEKEIGAPADGVLGQADFTSAVDQFGRAHFGGFDIFAESQSRIWIVEFGNNRILRFETDRSAEIAARAALTSLIASLNAQIAATNQSIKKLKKKIKKLRKRGNRVKAKKLSRKLRGQNRLGTFSQRTVGDAVKSINPGTHPQRRCISTFRLSRRRIYNTPKLPI